MPNLTVSIVHGHTLVRAGIRALLEQIEGIEVVAEAKDVVGLLPLLGRTKPGIVLLADPTAETNEFNVFEKIAREFPNVRVIVLTAHETSEYATWILRQGAAGCLPLSAASSELEQAIAIVARGDTYIWPEVSKESVEPPTERESLAKLSPRQREVLTLIADGYTTKQIARVLDISTKTVESHRAQLMERLNIHDVAGLVRFAIKMGLIRID